MTLTDFLLARIAEDEADAPHVTIQTSRFPEEAEGMTARWLAECEAKRRIVEAHVYIDHAWFPEANKHGDVPPTGRCWTCRDEMGPCPTLRALALPYADHPDYREEWKP